ncbi:hypothetical protein C8Q79DRAFT_993862 [Trametes meyenii]|nr:hypothetical protein C8Q79DRAFT_993862 [Trametes meyenii]
MYSRWPSLRTLIRAFFLLCIYPSLAAERAVPRIHRRSRLIGVYVVSQCSHSAAVPCTGLKSVDSESARDLLTTY